MEKHVSEIKCPSFSYEKYHEFCHQPHSEQPETKFPYFLLDLPEITITGSTVDMQTEGIYNFYFMDDYYCFNDLFNITNNIVSRSDSERSEKLPN